MRENEENEERISDITNELMEYSFSEKLLILFVSSAVRNFLETIIYNDIFRYVDSTIIPNIPKYSNKSKNVE